MLYTNVAELLKDYDAIHPRDLASKLDLLITGTGIYEAICADGQIKPLEDCSFLEAIEGIRLYRLEEGSDQAYLAGHLMFPFSDREFDTSLTQLSSEIYDLNLGQAKSILPELSREDYMRARGDELSVILGYSETIDGDYEIINQNYESLEAI